MKRGTCMTPLLQFTIVLLSLFVVLNSVVTNNHYYHAESGKSLRDQSIIRISKEQSTISKYQPLALVFEGGCSGSTAIGHFIEEIIVAHNLQRYNVGFEFMDTRTTRFAKRKNPMYHQLRIDPKYENHTHDEMLIETVRLAKQNAEQSKQLFYFKVHTPKVEGKYRESLDEIGINYFGVYRDNVIDRCICTTKDCFANSAGYPVFKHNGTKTGICFDRRKQKRKQMDLPEIAAFFNNPKQCLGKSLAQQNRIKSKDFPSISEESLFEFEYTNDDEAWERSKNAWMAMLQTFLLDQLDERILSVVLKKNRNTKSLPPSHEELIYNFSTFKRSLNGTKWGVYLRE